MNASSRTHGANSRETKRVMLDVLLNILSKYERGAGELSAELEIPEITPELLMLVCLAAPEVDDLILGFIRDDLQVVSLDDQTRRIAERDIGFLERDPSHRMRDLGGTLGRQLNVRQRAEADARIARGQCSQLEQFILAHKDIFERVLALKHADLARWVMLGLMREMDARARGSAVLASWLEKLRPEMKDRIRIIRERYGAQSFGQPPAVAGATSRRPGHPPRQGFSF